ncbi:MAG: DUF5131 family protein [Vicinamibacterales bacterium]
MSTTTGIQWTDHTFNIAWGCTKVSAGCTNCYADRDATRYGFKVWGPQAERRTFGEKHWNEPLRWNRAAAKAGVRRRVFCSSMCDVFEDHPTIDAERELLWCLIKDTPWLDWQLLTKRADRMQAWATKWRENLRYSPHEEHAELSSMLTPWPLPNVWAGVSVEDQATADARIPLLLQTPAAVRFVSVEPMIGPVDLNPYLIEVCDIPPLDWCIVGGESGPGARPCDVDWIRSIVDQCRATRTACFVKQLGARRIEDGCHHRGHTASLDRVRDRKGGDSSEWPADLRVREFPG